MEREALLVNSITDMIGYGTYNVPRGTWSDDTSMTLATLDSLKNGIDFEDMMKKFCDWFENARYTPSGVVLDIGNATRKSIFLYLTEKRPAVQVFSFLSAAYPARSQKVTSKEG